VRRRRIALTGLLALMLSGSTRADETGKEHIHTPEGPAKAADAAKAALPKIPSHLHPFTVKELEALQKIVAGQAAVILELASKLKALGSQVLRLEKSLANTKKHLSKYLPEEN